MSDLKKYISKRKRTDKKFAKGFDAGYEQFEIGVILRQTHKASGLTQEEFAYLLNTKKAAISKLENSAEDIKSS
jgi:DNA-binding transcriptional regulator YiaG